MLALNKRHDSATVRFGRIRGEKLLRKEKKLVTICGVMLLATLGLAVAAVETRPNFTQIDQFLFRPA